MFYIILIIICLYVIFLAFKSFNKNEFNMFGFNFCKYTLGWFFRFWYPFKTENKKVIPKEGPVLFCGNLLLIYTKLSYETLFTIIYVFNLGFVIYKPAQITCVLTCCF